MVGKTQPLVVQDRLENIYFGVLVYFCESVML